LTTTAKSFDGRSDIQTDLRKWPGFNSRTHLLLVLRSQRTLNVSLSTAYLFVRLSKNCLITWS